jgi:DNA polymerase-4
VGARAERRLHDFGLHTIGDVAGKPEEFLARHFGEAGRHIWHLAQGQDDRSVVPDREAKSVSTETTFAHDIGDRVILRGWLLELSEQLGQRLRQLEVRARTISLKVRSADFRTLTRSVTLPEATDLTEVLRQAVVEMFQKRVPQRLFPIRLLGVGASGLVRDLAVQGELFDDGWRAKQSALDQTLDEIRSRYGRDAIRRGGSLDRRED